MKVFITQVVGR